MAAFVAAAAPALSSADLLGYPLRLHQRVPALGGDCRDSRWPWRSPDWPWPGRAAGRDPGVSIEASTCACLHMRPDILLPALQVAADPRVDRRLVVGLDGAGQHQVFARRRRARAWRARRSGPPAASVHCTRSCWAASPADEAVGGDGARQRRGQPQGPAAAGGGAAS